MTMSVGIWAKRALSLVVVALMMFSIVRALAAPAATDASDADVANSRRVLNQPSKAAVGSAGGIAGNAIVEPADRETKLAPAIAGRIDKLWVQEGELVQAGALLVELENAQQRAALAAAEADVAVARADYEKAMHGQRREDVEAAVLDAEAAAARAASSADVFSRLSKLVPGVSTTTDELERASKQSESDRKTADALASRRMSMLAGSRAEDLLAARARWTAAGARRDQAAALLAQTRVLAPITGRVLQLKVRPGEYMAPGGADPLLILGDTRTLRARIDIDERDVDKLRLGAPAFVVADAAPEHRRSGHVVEIGKRMGRKNVRTDDPRERIDIKILEVVVALDDRSGLYPGQRVTGYIAP